MRGIHGRENTSKLVEAATSQILAWLGDPAILASDGKVTGFRDARGQAHILVSEDSHPEPARSIQPLVEIRLPEIGRAEIHCDRPHQRTASGEGRIALRLSLAPHECAVITINPLPPMLPRKSGMD